MTPTTGRRRVYGVDFSGAQDAGAGVWLASATRQDGTLFVESCFPGEALPGSGRERAACLPALREFLARADDCVVGMDFPFGLPAELVDAGTWNGFVDGFPDGAADPESWAETCRTRAESIDGDRVELKRATEELTDAPFSPYNLRMRSGTYYGLAEVLQPLVERRAVCVLPMQPPNPGLPWLVEACPAVTLDRLDVDAEGYKTGDDAEAKRAEILDALESGDAFEAGGEQAGAERADEGDDERTGDRQDESDGSGADEADDGGDGEADEDGGVGDSTASRRVERTDAGRLPTTTSVTMPPAVRDAAVETRDGDALDAIVAAVGVAQALERGDPFAPGTVDARTRLEGRIYG